MMNRMHDLHASERVGSVMRGAVAVLLVAYGAISVMLGISPAHRPHAVALAGYFPPSVTGAFSAITVVVGVAAIFLAHGLARGKRRAYLIAVGALVAASVASALHGHLLAAGTAILLLLTLALGRGWYTGQSDPNTRRAAVLAFLGTLGIGSIVGLVFLQLHASVLVGDTGWPARLLTVLRGAIGIGGPVGFSRQHADWTFAWLVGAFSIVAVVLGGYLYLRAAEPAPYRTPAQTLQLRGLLEGHGERDSLGYFALREDKSLVLSATGKAGVPYRVVAGVALISGDPIGDPEAWPGAIERYLEMCRRNSWVPGSLGCSAVAARTLQRVGMKVLEIGDEAIVAPARFSLSGRAMRNVRQMVNRVERLGYTAVLRDVGELSLAQLVELEGLAARWRATSTERGFSMALGTIGGPGSVIVTATREVDGVETTEALLQFVPWGQRGWSLDLMRRSPDAAPGMNEFLISRALLAAPQRGIERVSLNFAMLRQAFAQGERLGAGWLARGWAAVLRLASRFYQLESLYRFNAKFDPAWVPRYLCYQRVVALPRIAYAAMEAERFVDRLPPLVPLMHRARPRGHDPVDGAIVTPSEPILHLT